LYVSCFVATLCYSLLLSAALSLLSALCCLLLLHCISSHHLPLFLCCTDGPPLQTCTILPSLSTSTTITCTTAPRGAGLLATFTVAVPDQTAVGTDTISFPVLPYIYSVSGCVNVLSRTIECPTEGGIPLTVNGYVCCVGVVLVCCHAFYYACTERWVVLCWCCVVMLCVVLCCAVLCLCLCCVVLCCAVLRCAILCSVVLCSVMCCIVSSLLFSLHLAPISFNKV
jgi:hypothetical protein